MLRLEYPSKSKNRTIIQDFVQNIQFQKLWILYRILNLQIHKVTMVPHCRQKANYKCLNGSTLLRVSVTQKKSKIDTKTCEKKIQSTSICMGSTSADSTNCGLKIFREEEFKKVPRKQNLNFLYVDSYFREGNSTPLQHSCLENPMDRGAWLQRKE